MRYADEQVDETFAPVKIGSACLEVCKVAEVYRQWARHFDGLCESPIEEQFAVAMAQVIVEHRFTVSVSPNGEIEEAETDFLLIPQFKWGFYRSDFALVDVRTGLTVLVECDGQEFHSSEDQKQHDIRKDEAAAALAMTTLRFTGSKIHNEARFCAQRVLFNAMKGAR